MLDSTVKACAAILGADPSISDSERKQLVALLKNNNGKSSFEPIRRLYKVAEVAQLLGVSRKRVFQLARGGCLVRAVFGTAKRASGFTEASVRALCEQRSSDTKEAAHE